MSNDIAIPDFLVRLVGELQIKLAAAEAQLAQPVNDRTAEEGDKQ